MTRLPWPALTALLMAMAFLPARPVLPGADLDLSWGVVLQEAARHHWQFGPEIAFTYGPLGYMSVEVFAPDSFWWTVGLRAILGAVCGWGFHVIGRGAGWGAHLPFLLLLALLTPTMTSFDIPWILPALLWLFAATSPDRQARVASVVLAVAVGVVALVKFTTFGVGAALALLLLVHDVSRRRVPWASIAFASTVTATWVLSGQHPGNFPMWWHASAETSAGYVEAMSTPLGPYQVRELLLFGLAALALLPMPLVSRLATGRTPRDAVVPTLALSLILFVQFKLGFVRQDAHVTAAMFAMPMIAVLACAPALGARASGRWRLISTCVILLAFTSYAYGLRRHFDRAAPPGHYRAWAALQLDAIAALVHPVATHHRLTVARERALAALRNAAPVMAMDGSVDVYGHHQGAVLAYPVAYAPRPVFQSYGAYTRDLAAMNRGHLENPRGPLHVLFDPETIDFRYPLLDDGASVPTLLGAFEPLGLTGRFLHLRRLDTPQPVRLTPLHTLTVRPFEEFRIPDTGGRVWATVSIDQTWLGRIIALAYKLPPIVVDVRTADGTVAEHRLIRDVAGEGMLLSPLVASADEMLAFMRGERAAGARRVVGWRVRPTWPAAYAETIAVRLATLDVEDEARP